MGWYFRDVSMSRIARLLSSPSVPIAKDSSGQTASMPKACTSRLARVVLSYLQGVAFSD